MGTKELQPLYQKTPQTLHIDTHFTQYTPVEQEYNDAKRKGMPTKNYDPHKPEENIDQTVKKSREQNKDLHYKPFCPPLSREVRQELWCGMPYLYIMEWEWKKTIP